MSAVLRTASTYRYGCSTARVDPTHQNVQVTLERLQFATSLAATRVRRAQAELHTLIAEALCDGIEPRMLAKPAEMPIAAIQRMSLMCEDETFSGRSADAHIRAIIDKKKETKQEIQAKSVAEEQQARFLTSARRNQLMNQDAHVSANAR